MESKEFHHIITAFKIELDFSPSITNNSFWWIVYHNDFVVIISSSITNIIYVSLCILLFEQLFLFLVHKYETFLFLLNVGGNCVDHI